MNSHETRPRTPDDGPARGSTARTSPGATRWAILVAALVGVAFVDRSPSDIANQDVYKRQSLARTRETWTLTVLVLMCSRRPIWPLVRPRAVSYTHLDVYKRQVNNRSKVNLTGVGDEA